ncbi:type II toxin-antitoxin system HicA family toxin [Leptospira brenneri]|uniref:Type II toxin-antitoxin system HicA family toxin n=1 Tax=Leptospira brenneri TaxID=2023182 RepID=A0A5F1Z647_9LEPT|nr:type II toxin-antitoxin system HicA family toxin [Leptospira brenneri]
MLVTGKELVKILKNDGWELDRISGSHHILKKKDKTLSVPVHNNRDIPTGTMNAILKQAGLK